MVELNRLYFSLEAEEDCRYDRLSVYKGTLFPNSTNYYYCGDYFPTRVTSTNNLLTLVFESDNIVTYTGFIFGYGAVQQNGNTSGTYIVWTKIRFCD